jgi:hypothetical protein
MRALETQVYRDWINSLEDRVVRAPGFKCAWIAWFTATRASIGIYRAAYPS